MESNRIKNLTPMKHMIRSLFIYDSDVNFQSDFSLEDSIRRLAWFLQKEKMMEIHPEGTFLAGNVSHKNVTLFRKNLAFGNSYRPLFKGHFVEIDGKLYLRGTFRMDLLTYLSIPLGIFCVLFYEFMVILLTINGNYSGDSLLTHLLRLLLLPAAMSLSLGFLVLIKKIFRTDVKWISEHVVDVLTSDSRMH